MSLLLIRLVLSILIVLEMYALLLNVLLEHSLRHLRDALVWSATFYTFSRRKTLLNALRAKIEALHWWNNLRLMKKFLRSLLIHNAFLHRVLQIKLWQLLLNTLVTFSYDGVIWPLLSIYLRVSEFGLLLNGGFLTFRTEIHLIVLYKSIKLIKIISFGQFLTLLRCLHRFLKLWSLIVINFYFQFGQRWLLFLLFLLDHLDCWSCTMWHVLAIVSLRFVSLILHGFLNHRVPDEICSALSFLIRNIYLNWLFKLAFEWTLLYSSAIKLIDTSRHLKDAMWHMQILRRCLRAMKLDTSIFEELLERNQNILLKFEIIVVHQRRSDELAKLAAAVRL